MTGNGSDDHIPEGEDHVPSGDRERKKNMFCAVLEIEAGKLDKIFERIHKAEEELQECYSELNYLGVVRILGPAEDRATENATDAQE